jgi:hypothetical protein
MFRHVLFALSSAAAANRGARIIASTGAVEE